MKRLACILALAAASFASAQERIRDVVYGRKMGVALTMDVFTPARANGIGVVYVVSGGWFSNHDNINAEHAKAFTDRGMTVFAVVHGSQPKFQMPEILSDMHRAMRFIRTNAAKWKVQPNRLGITGGSAGGHLSLMLGAYGAPGSPEAKDPVDRAGSRPDAIAIFFPPTDMLNYGGPGIRPFKNPVMRIFWPAFGITAQTPETELERMAKEFSPIYGVTATMPPTLIVHGDKDALAPLQQSEIFVKKLDEVKVPNRLIVRAGMNHGWPDMRSDLAHCAEWFEKHLSQ